MRKRLTSLLLSIALVLTSADFTAFAAESDIANEIVEETQETEKLEEREEAIQESDTQIQTENVKTEQDKEVYSQDLEENIPTQDTVWEEDRAESILSEAIGQPEDNSETQTSDEAEIATETAHDETSESETESITENIMDDSQLRVTSSNSFGKLLTKSMEEEILELEQTPDNNISSITVEGKNAVVEFVCTADATLVVAIYDEAGIKMLASGKTEVTTQQVKTTVTIDIDSMPAYFIVKGYLVTTDTLKPLSSVYETPMYTKEMQELLKKTTDDFDAEKVINLDENKDNNFAVADDDTKVISNAVGENIISEFDDNTQICVITHANEEITSLQADDIFVYEYEDNEILVVKVADIIVVEEADGTKTATIYGQETTLDEAFAYLKIDTESELNEAQIDTSETVDGVAYEGIFQENNARAIDIDKSISWSVKFTLLEEKSSTNDKLTGDVLFGIDFKTKVYLSTSYYYVEIKCDYKVKVGVTLSDKSELLKIKLLKVPIKIYPTTGITIEFLPSFVIEASAKISIEGTIEGTFGYALSKDEGLRNISSKPSVDAEAKGEVELFVGISLEPKIVIVNKKIANASMDVTAGGVVNAKMDPHADEGAIIHECTSCLDGDIFAQISLEVGAELNIINKKIKVTSSKLEKTYKIADFYYSVDFNEFAFTVCPHHKYLVKVTVLDKNSKPVTNAYVENGINSISYSVDNNGIAKFYLLKGKYTLKTYLKDNKNITAEKNITIVDREKDVKIVLSGYDITKNEDNYVNQVEMNFGTTAAIVGDGRLYTWGINGIYQLGNGDKQHSNVPINILDNIDTVTFGETSTAVSKDGKLYIWGYNGNSYDDASYYKRPKLIADNIQSVIRESEVGLSDRMAITNNGDLYTWRQDDCTADYEKSPIKLLENVKNSSSNTYTKSAITKNNELYLWRGVDRLFDYLDGDITKSKPVKVMDNVAVFKESQVIYGVMEDSKFAATYGILSTDGSLYMLGNNDGGQLGNGISGIGTGSANPVKVLDNIVDFGMEYDHFWALDDKGGLYTWGDNMNGVLGTGDTDNRTVPVKILENIKEVYDGFRRIAAVTKDGDLYIWGDNDEGGLGIGNMNDEYCATPTKILENVKTVVLEGYLYSSSADSCAAVITNDGKLYMWGQNSSGQLGDNTNITRYRPVKIMDNVKTVCFNGGTTAAVTNDGELYMWGYNTYGQLGNGTNVSSNKPVKVTFPSVSSKAKSINNYKDLNSASDSTEDADLDDSENIDLFQSATYGSRINGKAVFNNLDANELYNIYEIKSKDTEDALYSENLLYIAQTTADKNGNIAYPYEPREDYADSVLFAVSKKAASSNPTTEENDVLSEDIPSDGIIPTGLWIAGITDYSYIGEAIKPEMRVYDNKKLLIEKTDYTIAYKNNLNVGKATITVTGKGNYAGKETATFNILPVDITGEDFSAEPFYVKVGEKAQSPVPEVYYMGTKLKSQKDFTIKYSNTSGVYAKAGEYSVTITGRGNYTGTRTLTLTAVSTIEKKSSMSIAKASLVGFEKSFIYTGKAHKQDCTLFLKTSEGDVLLTEGTDYTVRYTNNTKAGTATVTYSGKGNYTGKLKKTYKIIPYDIGNNYEGKINYESYFECVYAKGGSKPKPVITFDKKVMKEGADYTLSYKNNKAVYGSQTPCVVVNGKGNFKGKLSINFIMLPQDLSKMTLVSCDKVYKDKVGNYKITPKLMDLDGKLLSAGKDFDKDSIIYTYETDATLEDGDSRKAGDAVEDTDIQQAGTQIRVTMNCGNSGNYTGTFTGVYRIVKADIKSAKVTIPNQTYTGKEITLDKSKITVTLSGKKLKSEDFDIVQYTDNVKKGKATVTIQGKGNYGGTKTVKFTIGSKGFLWWWRKK